MRPHRLDCVQAKVTLAGSQIPAASEALGLAAGPVARRQVYFCVDSDATAEYGGIAPLDDGIILRLRQHGWPGSGRSDATVKLRPVRRSRLSTEWLGMRGDGGARGDGGVHGDGAEVFRLEADWTGEQRVLAASLVADRGTRQVADVLAGTMPLREMFSPRQRRFLRECGDRPVDVDTLAVLGPIDAVRWTTPVTVAGFPVTVERWMLAVGEDRAGHGDTATGGGRGIDLLELAIRVDPGGAEIAQIAFEAALHRLGLVPEEDRETKTGRALALLTGKS